LDVPKMWQNEKFKKKKKEKKKKKTTCAVE
jgi:hypothetical protein